MIGRAWLVVAAVLGALMLANGIYMLLAPEAWYWQVPGVPDRGPFNQHFVRDIGIAYGLIGLSFIGAIRWQDYAVVLWGWPTAWLGEHGLFHIWEVAVGICGPEALLEDFLGVMVPALVGAALTWRATRRVGASSRVKGTV